MPSPELHRVARALRWFERDPGEALVGEEYLADVQLGELQALFSRPVGDPMYDPHPITASEASALQRLVKHRIDLAEFDYFLEADGLE